MIRANETEKLQLMFKLMDRVPDEGIDPMLADLGMNLFYCYCFHEKFLLKSFLYF